ncbi:MAG TPA: hypothetical protein VEF76_01220 [Patescibacteria group bacterium]|nr:hypothetical protein [Patescibacteria group bacterium]
MGWKDKLKQGKDLAGKALSTGFQKAVELDNKIEDGKTRVVNAIENKLATVGRDKRKKAGDAPKGPAPKGPVQE